MSGLSASMLRSPCPPVSAALHLSPGPSLALLSLPSNFLSTCRPSLSCPLSAHLLLHMSRAPHASLLLLLNSFTKASALSTRRHQSTGQVTFHSCLQPCSRPHTPWSQIVLHLQLHALPRWHSRLFRHCHLRPVLGPWYVLFPSSGSRIAPAPPRSWSASFCPTAVTPACPAPCPTCAAAAIPHIRLHFTLRCCLARASLRTRRHPTSSRAAPCTTASELLVAVMAPLAPLCFPSAMIFSPMYSSRSSHSLLSLPSSPLSNSATHILGSSRSLTISSCDCEADPARVAATSSVSRACPAPSTDSVVLPGFSSTQFACTPCHARPSFTLSP